MLRFGLFPVPLESRDQLSGYSTLELRTLAQICLRRFGHSKLAERLGETSLFPFP